MSLPAEILSLADIANFPRRLVRDYVASMLEESPIKVRSLTLEDYEAAAAVERDAWGDEMSRFRQEQFAARVAKFPEGNVCAIQGGRMLGIINTQRIDYDFARPIPTWYEATENGFLRHAPAGEYLYGVNLSIRRNALLVGTGTVLWMHMGLLMTELNVRGIVIGVRPFGYRRFAGRMSFDEYLWNRDGTVRDPEVGMYCRIGFRVKAVLPGYFDDRDSRDYGVLVLLENPHFGERGRGADGQGASG